MSASSDSVHPPSPPSLSLCEGGFICMYSFIHNPFSVPLGILQKQRYHFCVYSSSFFLLPQEQFEVTENNLRICMV